MLYKSKYKNLYLTTEIKLKLNFQAQLTHIKLNIKII